MLANLLDGLVYVASLWSIGAALSGLAAGIVIGAIPGLTATMAVAVLTPFTFFMDATIGIPFLLGIYKGAIYGGSIPAILINTPGTAAAAATALDGNVLARRGEGRRALEISLYASVIADFLATILLIGVAGPLASIAIKFGAPELTMLFAFSLTMIAAVSGDSLLKGLISAAIGILLACVGLDPMSGVQRLTFGSVDLLAGISLVPLLIGMFALSEVLVQVEAGAGAQKAADPGRTRASLADLRRTLVTILRATGIGAFLGALPGIGAEISCWIAYGDAKRRSRRPEEFGRGSIEGVAAAEAGNNAVCPSALIPMMVFGIPGDTITAVLLGAFMAQGLLPGPMLFASHGPVLYGLFALLLVTNVMLLAFGLVAIRHLAKIVLIPPGLLLPSVTALCFTGAFAVNSALFDIVIMLAGGLAGYLMRKASVPISPLVIALLIAPRLENSLRQSLVLSDGDLSIFVTRPIAASIAALLAGVLILFGWRTLRPRRVSDAVGEST